MARRAPSTIAAVLALLAMHCGAAAAPDPFTSEGASDRRAGADGGAPNAAASAPDGGAAPSTNTGGATAGLPPMVLPSFVVGYNEGWFGPHYGSDFTNNYDAARVAATFDGIVRAGGKVVRLWLFEGRQGIVMTSGAPQIQSLDPTLLVHLGEVLDAARARGLWVYVTALDGNEMPADAGPLRDFYWNLLNDSYGEGQAFREQVLAPMLAVLSAKRDVVYGFDVVNEIAAPRTRSYWPEPFLAPRAFIERTTTFVKSKAPWLKVTATAGWDTAAVDIATGFFSGLGLDFYDLHVYSDAGNVLGVNEVCARAAQDNVPIILGEFGQRSHVIDDGLQSNATRAFLSGAKNACFKGALAWRYDAAEVWWDFVRDDGTFRPAVSVMQQFAAAP